MAYSDQYTAASDTGFISRVAMAIVQTAVVINGEASAVAHSAQRTQLALSVLHDPLRWASIFAFGVAADPTIDTTASDGAIFSRIDYIWNDYALAYTT